MNAEIDHQLVSAVEASRPEAVASSTNRPLNNSIWSNTSYARGLQSVITYVRVLERAVWAAAAAAAGNSERTPGPTWFSRTRDAQSSSRETSGTWTTNVRSDQRKQCRRHSAAKNVYTAHTYNIIYNYIQGVYICTSQGHRQDFSSGGTFKINY